MSVKQIRRKLENLGEEAVKAYKEMLKDPQTPRSLKAKICASIFDRVGAPVLRATITQSVALQEFTPEELLERRKILQIKAEKIESRVKELEATA